MLAPELGASGIFIDAHSITTGRRRGRLFRGGYDSYTKLVRDLVLWMKQDQNPDAWFTTMVDLYRLPTDFPGYAACQAIPEPRRRVECLEGHLARDVTERFPDDTGQQRFIPYIQLHEFEALLFSDAAKFLHAFPDEQLIIAQLLAIRTQCGGPENIDDGEDTAPSKRILQLLPDYVKTVSGLLIVKQISLSLLRSECPHFGAWIGKLLGLVTV